jgi:hypothetical protein
MKLRKLALVPIAAAVMALSTPAVANSVTFQGVTFSTTVVDADTVTFMMSGANAATGDWGGVNFLRAFSLGVGGAVTGATITPGNLTFSGLELTASGCDGGASGKACFSTTSPISLAPSMSWNIDFVGTGPYNFNNPDLKVNFLVNATDDKKTGTNYSLPIPEPETYAMLLAGLGLMGVVARRRQRSLAA